MTGGPFQVSAEESMVPPHCITATQKWSGMKRGRGQKGFMRAPPMHKGQEHNLQTRRSLPVLGVLLNMYNRHPQFCLQEVGLSLGSKISDLLQIQCYLQLRTGSVLEVWPHPQEFATRGCCFCACAQYSLALPHMRMTQFSTSVHAAKLGKILPGLLHSHPERYATRGVRI